MAVLITGGYGLLGSHLACKFANEGEKVLLVDVSKRKLDYLEQIEDKLEFIPTSILNFPKLTEIFLKNKGRIQGIVHTVSLMPSPFFSENPYEAININFMGTCNMLELARVFKVEKFLYISSGAVYGEVEGRPSELTHPFAPADLYGAIKASSEMIGQQYQKYYGLDFRSARPYFFFGPGRFPSEQTYLFKHLLGPLEGLESLKLERGADQKLGFTYIKDIADGCYLLYKAAKLKQKAFNIATDEVTSFLEMVRLAQKYSDMPTQVEIGPGKFMPRGETLNISAARDELGFRPAYSTEDGMKEYARWIRENKK